MRTGPGNSPKGAVQLLTSYINIVAPCQTRYKRVANPHFSYGIIAHGDATGSTGGGETLHKILRPLALSNGQFSLMMWLNRPEPVRRTTHSWAAIAKRVGRA
jgi:hypothetical protein